MQQDNDSQDPIKINGTKKQIEVSDACIDASKFVCVSLNNTVFEDVAFRNVKITNANMSDLEIEGAQLGGAYIHNIGMPPKGHPFYDANAKQRPLKFEDCELTGTTISNCNLQNVEITDCDLAGMKINGILVEDLLTTYKKQTG